MTSARKDPSSHKTRQQRREDALRPSPFLGYDHDKIAQYLMTRQAWKTAEDVLRRAIWLNPYEPHFKEHLALCLLEQKRFDQALAQAAEVLKEKPDWQSGQPLVKFGVGRGDEIRHVRPPL